MPCRSPTGLCGTRCGALFGIDSACRVIRRRGVLHPPFEGEELCASANEATNQQPFGIHAIALSFGGRAWRARETLFGDLAYNCWSLRHIQTTYVHTCPPPLELLLRFIAQEWQCVHARHYLPVARPCDSGRIQGHRISRRAFPGRAGIRQGLNPHPARHIAREARVAHPVQRAADGDASQMPIY